MVFGIDIKTIFSLENYPLCLWNNMLNIFIQLFSFLIRVVSNQCFQQPNCIYEFVVLKTFTWKFINFPLLAFVQVKVKVKHARTNNRNNIGSTLATPTLKV